MTMTEEWRSIPGRPPYEASNLGNVRNGMTGKVLKPIKHKSRGHYTVKVGGGRNCSGQFLHRLVLMAFHGLPKEGQIGCHKNDIKEDNRIDNLYWGSYKQNTADQIKNGKFYFAVGEGNGMTKYSDETVKKIKKEYTGKRGDQSFLARKYGMSISNVHMIVHGEARAI